MRVWAASWTSKAEVFNLEMLESGTCSGEEPGNLTRSWKEEAFHVLCYIWKGMNQLHYRALCNQRHMHIQWDPIRGVQSCHFTNWTSCLCLGEKPSTVHTVPNEYQHITCSTRYARYILTRLNLAPMNNSIRPVGMRVGECITFLCFSFITLWVWEFCLYVYLCTVCLKCPWRPEEGLNHL